MNTVCIAVLNYNGRHHLEHLVPSLERACKNSTIPTSIVILDNQSTQDDVEWIAQQCSPYVRCIVAPRNDFLFSYNELLKDLEDDIVVIINNDVRVHQDFLGPLLAHLRNPDVFAASARSLDWDGREVTSGPAELRFANGFYGWSFNTDRQETCHTLFNSGACMAVDRKKFLELGGFNRLFHPAYCEDLDLGFRAWRRGWRCIYEPSSVFWHREHASWSLSSNSRPNQLNLINSLVFQWSSLPMERDWGKRWVAMVKIVIGEACKGRFDFLKALIRAAKVWRLKYRELKPMKASRMELDSICRRIQATV